MKKQVQTSIAISLIASAPCALAQSKNFEGNSVSLGSGSIRLSDAANSASEKWNSTGKLEFTHFRSLNDSWLLGFGIGVDLGSMRSKSFGGSGTGDITYFSDFASPFDVLEVTEDPDSAYYAYQSGGNRQINQKNTLSLSVIPAFAFSKESLGYLRFSANRAKFSTSGGGGSWLSSLGDNSFPWIGGDGCTFGGDGSAACAIVAEGGGTSGSKTLSGYGFGVGYRHNLDDNIFLQAEFGFVKFKKSSELDIKAENQGVIISIGYRF